MIRRPDRRTDPSTSSDLPGKSAIVVAGVISDYPCSTGRRARSQSPSLRAIRSLHDRSWLGWFLTPLTGWSLFFSPSNSSKLNSFLMYFHGHLTGTMSWLTDSPFLFFSHFFRFGALFLLDLGMEHTKSGSGVSACIMSIHGPRNSVCFTFCFFIFLSIFLLFGSLPFVIWYVSSYVDRNRKNQRLQGWLEWRMSGALMHRYLASAPSVNHKHPL
jgi:hypothetical protein